jgi:predicted GTPase
VNGDVSFSQSLEAKANLAIRPKTTISNMLASIPVNCENKQHLKFLAPFFPSQNDTLTHSYDTASVLKKLVLATHMQEPHSGFQISITFSLLREPNFIFKVRARQKFSSNYKTILDNKFKPNFHIQFILTCVPIY